MVQIRRNIVRKALADKVVYGYNNKMLYITVHQTGNVSRGANADMHGRLQANGNSRNASWHYTVDDIEAVQSFEDNAQTFNAGDGRGDGNLNGISVESCVNVDGDYGKTIRNTAELVAHLMKKHNIPLSRVVQHNRWSGKNCPAQIRAGKDGITWSKFLDMVKEAYDGKPAEPAKPTAPKPATKSIEQLVQEVIDGKHGTGEARKRSLGSQYAEVQRIVNARLAPQPKPVVKTDQQLAQEVIDGKHGSGDARKRSLGNRYSAVQAIVNKMLGAKAKPALKSTAQVVQEVVDGKWGNNPQRAERLRKAGYNPTTIQREVNKRFK